jgi:hypothetical protein
LTAALSSASAPIPVSALPLEAPEETIIALCGRLRLRCDDGIVHGLAAVLLSWNAVTCVVGPCQQHTAPSAATATAARFIIGRLLSRQTGVTLRETATAAAGAVGNTAAMAEEGEQKQRLSDIHLEPYAHTDDKSDKVAYLRSQEQERRELRVAKSRAMIARKAVSDCYEKEGVNHYQNCREVVEHYLDLIWRKDKYGMLQPPTAAATDA